MSSVASTTDVAKARRRCHKAAVRDTLEAIADGRLVVSFDAAARQAYVETWEGQVVRDPKDAGQKMLAEGGDALFAAGFITELGTVTDEGRAFLAPAAQAANELAAPPAAPAPKATPAAPAADAEGPAPGAPRISGTARTATARSALDQIKRLLATALGELAAERKRVKRQIAALERERADVDAELAQLDAIGATPPRAGSGARPTPNGRRRISRLAYGSIRTAVLDAVRGAGPDGITADAIATAAGLETRQVRPCLGALTKENAIAAAQRGIYRIAS